MTKFAIYARVSDDKIMEDGSRRQDVNRQVEKIKAWLNQGQWGQYELEIYLDDGKSAFKDDYSSRPAFCKLIKDIRSRQVQRVFVEDLTRWSRRIEEGLRTMREAHNCGCTVTSLGEGEIDITIPDGWFKSAIAFLMAEWASRSQSWKVKSGMASAKAKGKNLGRHVKGCVCDACLRKREGQKRVGQNFDPPPACAAQNQEPTAER